MKGRELTPHIGFFGRRNSGKSSLVNYLVGQSVSIVSDLPGSTTDPVKKTVEISGVGPVVFIDTAGIDDGGQLGDMRKEKTSNMLSVVDLAVIVIPDSVVSQYDKRLIEEASRLGVTTCVVCSKGDICQPTQSFLEYVSGTLSLSSTVVSTSWTETRDQLISFLRQQLPESSFAHRSFLSDVIEPHDHVVLVTPIDSSAPEGRIILPQVQVIRDLLDNNALIHICKDSELPQMVSSFQTPPRLVITDSQVFKYVASTIPLHWHLTSFSIVLARAKGLFNEYLKGTPTISHLKDGDKVMLLESCSHNVTCEDIGRVKIPRLLRSYTKKNLSFDVIGGLDPIPYNVGDYALVVQCGGCVITPKQLASRLAPVLEHNVPISNYGLSLAYVNGIFERTTEIFKPII